MKTATFVRAATAIALAVVLGACSTSAPINSQSQPSSAAPPAPTTATQVSTWNYIDPSTVAYAALLPAPDESASKFELGLIAGIRSTATDGAKRWAGEADADSACDLVCVLDPSIGNVADAKARVAVIKAKYPATSALLLRAEADSTEVKKRAKATFLRPRPAGGPLTGADSYPSGHATRASTQARLLAAVAPGKERELMVEAWYRGLARLTLGVHHPSDVAAGYVLGERIAADMLERGNDRFRSDLEAAQAEWRGK